MILINYYYNIIKKMTLNFQNKIVFPAPEHSYTPETAYGQVIYIPRDMAERRMKLEALQKESQNMKASAQNSNIVSKV